MALVISSNVPALNAQNNLNRSTVALNKSIERLSTGFKINRGADGPAALVISEKQRAQIAGLRAAIENTEKAASVIQTAEGALNEINTILVKMRSLALDSANTGVNDADAIAANQAEIDNSIDTIDRIARNTQFSTKQLLDGSVGVSGSTNDTDTTFIKGGPSTYSGTYDVVVTGVAERAYISSGFTTTTLAADEVLTINGVNITLNSGTDKAGVISRINEFSEQTGVVADDPAGAEIRLRTEAFGSDADITVVSNVVGAASSTGFGTTQQTDVGANIAGTINALAASGKGNTLTSTEGASKGTIVRVGEDTTSATTLTSTVTGAQGTVSVQNNALKFQIGPNRFQTAEIAINNIQTDALGVALSGNVFNSLSEINVNSFNNSQDALEVIDNAIDEISTLRGDLGAFQKNTLESVANNMRSTLENTVAAESVIRDTDFAETVAEFTNNQTLVQVGTSVLSSATQTTQSILSLLQ